MTEDSDTKEEAKNLFTQSKDEALADDLRRMKGWFDVTNGEIHLGEEILRLDNGSQYLTYLLASFVAEYIDERNSEFVEHSEANRYFGWGNGRTAAEYASDFSEYLNTEDGTKAIAPAQLSKVVDHVESKLEE